MQLDMIRSEPKIIFSEKIIDFMDKKLSSCPERKQFSIMLLFPMIAI